jgi:hypothetical protein
MTIRAIQVGRHGDLYEPAVSNKESKKYYTEWVSKTPFEKPEEGVGRQIKTMQGVPGIEERMNRDNWTHTAADFRNHKMDKGLYDVSAGLLNPKRPIVKGVHKGEHDAKPQLHTYSGKVLWVFMPVPSEQDMTLYYQLNDMAKKPTTTSLSFKAFMSVAGSRFTRIKFAFETDAGLAFFDAAPEGEPYGKFRYGHAALYKWKENETDKVPKTRRMSDGEIAERKLAARKYTQILQATNENEIVLAYRQHGLSSTPVDQRKFPVYAFYNDSPSDLEHRYSVVKPSAGQYLPTNQFITDNGLLWP